MADDDMEENWESLLDNGGFDKKLEEIDSRQQLTKPSAVMANKTTHCQVIIEEEVPRTQYTRPEPSVKILKRPMGVKKGELNGGDRTRQQQPIKTLQQREAEYAQARLRILGAAKSEEDAIQESLSRVQLVEEQSGVQSSSDCEFSSSSSTSSSPLNTSSSPSLLLSRPEIVKVSDVVEITRSPKGPDGSRGFNVRR